MKITILKIRESGEEDNVYVFENWHERHKLQPFIKKWCEWVELLYKDHDETWYYDIFHTKTLTSLKFKYES